MKRKKLMEFTEWFAKNRRAYDQTDGDRCLAAHAVVWSEKLKRDDAVYSSGFDLQEIFNLSARVADDLYWHDHSWTATRAQAVIVLKRLARTGKVKWPEPVAV